MYRGQVEVVDLRDKDERERERKRERGREGEGVNDLSFEHSVL